MDKRSLFRKDLECFFKVTSKWILCIRSQQIGKADNVFSSWINWFEKLLTYDEMISLEHLLLDNFECLLGAYEDRDYILCADYMEKGIADVIKQKIADWMLEWKELFNDGEYCLEYTESASITVAKRVEEKKIYLHSNCNPWQEAFMWTEGQIKTGIENYYVAGLGLGYHAILLAENPLIRVIVYEEDRKMIELYQKNIADCIPGSDNIEVVYDPGYQKYYHISTDLDEKREKLCLYYPSIQTIKHDELKQKMKRLFLQIDNAKRWENNFVINFAYNSKHVKDGIEKLQKELAGKKVYLIAGGPSLDKNITLLKKRSKDSVVMTVGTSLRRCMQEEIEPDYVIITDPKPYVHKQIEGLEDCGIPLILLSTTFAHVTRDYKGRKYILYQKGFDQAERYAKQKQYKMVETGGSVTTTALDLCIRCKVEKVIFLGLDLAFTGGKMHHNGTNESNLEQTVIFVPDIYGNLVGTAENLNLYRLWIERKIQEAKKGGSKTVFIDASEGGARIKGTIVHKLCDIL